MKFNIPRIENEDIEIEVNKRNYPTIKKLLIKEKYKIIDKLRNYKTAGLIGSIYYPRNKTIQSKLNKLVKKKRELTDTIRKITKIFK